MMNKFKFLILIFSMAVSGLSFSQCSYSCIIDAGSTIYSHCPGESVQIGTTQCFSIRRCTRTLQWMPSNLIISGQGTCTPTVNPTTTTTFYLQITYQGNCCCTGASGDCATASCDSLVKLASMTVVVDTSGCRLGKFEEKFNPGISVSPNPNSGIFSVEFVDPNHSFENAKPEVFVFSFDGKKVYQGILDEKKTLVNLSNQPKGVYFIRIMDQDKELLSNKILLQ